MITVVYYELYSSLLEYDGLQHVSREADTLRTRKWVDLFAALEGAHRVAELLIECGLVPKPQPGEKSFQTWDILTQDQRNRSWGYELRASNATIVPVPDPKADSNGYIIRSGWEVRGVHRTRRTETVEQDGKLFSRQAEHVETTDWLQLTWRRWSLLGNIVEPLVTEHRIGVAERSIVLFGQRSDLLIRDGGVEEEP